MKEIGRARIKLADMCSGRMSDRDWTLLPVDITRIDAAIARAAQALLRILTKR